MDTKVFFEVAVAWEGLVAHLALKRLLACMLPLVDGQVHLGVIPLLTAVMGTSVFVYHIL